MKKVLKKIWEVMREVIGFVCAIGVLIFLGISMLLSYGVLIPIGSIILTITDGGSLIKNLRELFEMYNEYLCEALDD